MPNLLRKLLVAEKIRADANLRAIKISTYCNRSITIKMQHKKSCTNFHSHWWSHCQIYSWLKWFAFSQNTALLQFHQSQSIISFSVSRERSYKTRKELKKRNENCSARLWRRSSEITKVHLVHGPAAFRRSGTWEPVALRADYSSAPPEKAKCAHTRRQDTQRHEARAYIVCTHSTHAWEPLPIAMLDLAPLCLMSLGLLDYLNHLLNFPYFLFSDQSHAE